VIGGIILCLVVGFATLSSLMSSTFETISQLESQLQDTNAPGSAAAKPGTAVDPKPAIEAPSKVGLALPAVMIFIACLMAVAYAYRVARKSKQTKEAEDDTPEQPEEEPSPDAKLFARRQDMRRIFRNNMTLLMDGHIKARHIMSRQLTAVRPSDPLSAVYEMLESKESKHAVVLNNDRHVLGIVSHSLAETLDLKAKAKDKMTPPATKIEADADFLPLMTSVVRQNGTAIYVPVVKNDVLVGVISDVDIYMAAQCAFQSLQDIAALQSSQQMERTNQGDATKSTPNAEQKETQELATASA